MIPRVIPCLLLKEKGLVKTVRFKAYRYIGDPINAVRIFNEMEADELMFLDIEASKQGRDIDWETVEEIANEAFMPVCYGGGIYSLKQVERLFRLGVEKVSLNTGFLERPQLAAEIVSRYGSQSVMVTLDVTLVEGRYLVYAHAKGRALTMPIEHAVETAVQHGAGEITINYVDRDGTMGGYDMELMRRVTQMVNIPVVASGGCGALRHMREVVEKGGASAVAAGSIFVYWGKLNGILINYPKREQLLKTFQ